MLDPGILAEYNTIRQTKNTSMFCHAPFTSMNFEQNGNVTVCCYNRTYLLGCYPNKTLKKIWYGQEANGLRHYMKKNDLPEGCEICHAQFLSKDFGGLRAQFYDNLAEAQYPEDDGNLLLMPKVMEFEISNVCNLECTMCSGYWSSAIRSNREKLPPLKSPYDEDFVRQLEVFIPYLSEARFLGGEPFLIKTYYQIWDLIIRLNPAIAVSITTNGTVLNTRVKEVVEHLRAWIVMSIDSLDKENYERIRANAKFDQVMENFHFFRDYTKRNNRGMTIAVCPMRSNWHEMPRFLDFCNQHGVRLFFNTVLRPEEASLMSMRLDDLSTVVNYLRSVKLTEETEIHVHNNATYLDLIKQISSYRGDLTLEYFAVASKLVEKRQYRKALQEMRKIPETHAMYHFSLTVSGNIQRLLRDFEGAQENLRRAIAMTRYGGESVLYRVWLSLDENRLKRELAHVVQVGQLLQQRDESEAGACEVLGSLYALQGRLADAMRAFDRLVELQPNRPQAHIRRGLACQLIGDRDQARVEVEAALALDPYDADALQLKAVL